MVFIILSIISISLLLVAAGSAKSQQGSVNNDYTGRKGAKYIFVFIGDGMGLPQVSSAEIYAGAKDSSRIDAPRSLTFTQFPAQGLTTTHDASSFITDSASAGTAIATGHKTLNGVICMDPETKTVPYESIAKQAGKAGMKVGVITSVSLDHATPATFYANVPSRKLMYEISLQMVDSGFDYFAGGQITDPDGKKSKMTDKPGNVWDYAKKNGYTVTMTKNDFTKLKPGTGKVIALTEAPADAAAMLYEIDRPEDVLSLADFTKKGIDLMQDNPKGFFLMVEGGKIDWACHANDGISSIKDVYAFDESIRAAMDFYEKHPNETLIIVTGDHECGGMTIGFSGTKYDTFFTKLDRQKMSFIMFDEKFAEMKKNNPGLKFSQVMPLITGNFGLYPPGSGTDNDMTDYEYKLLEEAFNESMKPDDAKSKSEEAYIKYGGYEPLSVTLTHILNQKAGIGWTTYSHTGVPVPTYAVGVGQDLFNGFYDNTDIYKKIYSIMKL